MGRDEREEVRGQGRREEGGVDEQGEEKWDKGREKRGGRRAGRKCCEELSC